MALEIKDSNFEELLAIGFMLLCQMQKMIYQS